MEYVLPEARNPRWNASGPGLDGPHWNPNEPENQSKNPVTFYASLHFMSNQRLCKLRLGREQTRSTRATNVRGRRSPRGKGGSRTSTNSGLPVGTGATPQARRGTPGEHPATTPLRRKEGGRSQRAPQKVVSPRFSYRSLTLSSVSLTFS